MFRLEFLYLKGHPKLGNLNLNLSELYANEEGEKPYTSVIIGPNGTGKSFILRTLSDIFRQFKAYSNSEKKDFSMPYSIHLRYRINENIFEIVTRRLHLIGKKGPQREYLFFKNRPIDLEFKDKTISELKTGFEITHRELEFPQRLLVNSIIPTDRFEFYKSNQGDFYQYLGARSTNSTSSTKSSVRRTIKHVFNAASESDNFKDSLRKLLNFLEFENSFKVAYKTKINKLFFSKNLTVENFKQYFEFWWDKEFEFTNRKEGNPIWSIPYYNQNFKQNQELTKRLVEFLNEVPNNQNRFKHKNNSTSKILTMDLFDEEIKDQDLEFISHLENLDIINLEGIQVQKMDKSLSINDISSGEYHLLISLISLFANIKYNSLVLIDEPEISLHPTWQMRYVTFLKNVFKNYPNCHFVLTTHSHFLVSDLEGKSSSVIALKRENHTQTLSAKLLHGKDTFGWSAESVLLEIFNVPTTRNFFIADRIGDILELISKKDRDEFLIKMKVGELLNQNVLSLPKNDPLKSIWDKIVIKYG